jgi:TrbL/VirB6 plasmid conjugal transfer protein
VLLAVLMLFMLSPAAPVSAGPFGGDPCRPADNPAPEAYGSGTDGMIKPPDHPNQKLQRTPVERLTYYDRYGTAGQTWYAVDMGCSDAMAMMGNALANTTFTLVRAIDRTTITVYQAAASESLLGWLKRTVDDVISGVGKTFNARYWSWVVILGAMWLAWWGLVRKRASKVTEGTIWMVAAMVGLIWLIARPADFTTLGTKVSEATSAAFNAALPQADTKGTTCIPAPNGRNPLASPDVDATTRNANGLWVALVCKPWLMGEFGTTDPNAKIVKDNADKLLWSQAVDMPETYGTAKVDLGDKADAYKDVAKNLKENYPGAYPVFQGKNWTSRVAVAFGALFAALVAGLLILVIAIALIVVKIAFLLLLVAGPIFLGIGIHPGIGRVIAIRWLELLLSMLLKQAALIGVLALLLWAYGLILGEGLPWGLQILLISLVTFAAFIYRKPFQHLFSAVGYSAVGAREKSEAQLDKSVVEARKSTVGAATAVLPGAAGYRLARGSKRDPADATALTDGSAGTAAERRAALAPADATAGADALAGKTRVGASAAAAGSGRPRAGAPPLNLPSRGGTTLGDAAARAAGVGGGTAVVAGAGDASSSGGGGKPTSWVAGRISGREGGSTAGSGKAVTSPGPRSLGAGSSSGGGRTSEGSASRPSSGGTGRTSGQAGTGGSPSGVGKPTSWAGRASGAGGSGGSAERTSEPRVRERASGDAGGAGSSAGGGSGRAGGGGFFGRRSARGETAGSGRSGGDSGNSGGGDLFGRRSAGGGSGTSGGGFFGGGSSGGGGSSSGGSSGGGAGDGSGGRGGSSGGNSGGSGRGWFGGSGNGGESNGGSGNGSGSRSGGSRSGGSRSGGPRSGGSGEPEVPKPRAGAGPGNRTPPPLWGRGSDAEPPIPFWLRPVDGAGERGRDD